METDEWMEAFGQMIDLAQRLKPKGMEALSQMIDLARRLKSKGENEDTASEYSKGLIDIGVKHELTAEETLDYGKRIWLLVRSEIGPNEYRCGVCQGIFTKGWSDEEADCESTELWPGVPKDECVLVCDVCFNRILPSGAPR
jgi:hypothetical protein